MSIVLQSSGGGSVTIAEPATASNFTQTLPAATGTVMVSGNMPAFRAYVASSQTVTNNVSTKVQLNAENFDTASCFDSTTNYRFTPNVAGYYQINAMIGSNGSSALTYNYIQLFKNGSVDSIAIYGPYSGSSNYGQLATLVYMNGTTDYLELYVTLSGTGTMTVYSGATIGTYMSGSLVRAA